MEKQTGVTTPLVNDESGPEAQLKPGGRKKESHKFYQEHREEISRDIENHVEGKWNIPSSTRDYLIKRWGLKVEQKHMPGKFTVPKEFPAWEKIEKKTDFTVAAWLNAYATMYSAYIGRR